MTPKNVIKALCCSAVLLLAADAYAQEQTGWTSGYVTTISNINGNACIQINDRGSTATNTTVLVDLTTTGGKAAFSTAMTAISTGQRSVFIWDLACRAAVTLERPCFRPSHS